MMNHNDSASNRNNFFFINNISYEKRAIRSQINIFVKLYFTIVFKFTKGIFHLNYSLELLNYITRVTPKNTMISYGDTLLNR